MILMKARPRFTPEIRGVMKRRVVLSKRASLARRRREGV